MKWKLLSLVIALALVFPAFAGHYKKVWEEKGQVDVVLFDDVDGHQKILFRGLPFTADRLAGPAVMVWDGIPVYQWSTPVYEFVVDVTAESLCAIEGDPKKGGQLLIPWMKSDGRQKINLRTLALGTHTVSIYFATVDDRGKLDRSRTAAPATQFRLAETDPPVAATTTGGQSLTATQLEDAIKQSYEQGAKAGKDAGAQERELEREKLLGELNKVTDELNKLRMQRTPSSQPMPTLVRYIPVDWQQKDWPDPKEGMVLVRNGTVVAQAEIFEMFIQTSRIWVRVKLPADFVIDKECRVERRTSRKGN